MELIFIILGILKIILIIVLSILGIALLILGLILFVPFRYSVKGDFYDGQKGTVKVTWLLKFFQLNYLYLGDSSEAKIKILGIPLPKKKEGKEEGKKRNEEFSKDNENRVKETKTDDANTKSKNISASKPSENEKLNIENDEPTQKTKDKPKETPPIEITKPTDGSPEEFIEDTGEKIYEEKETIIETIKDVIENIRFIIHYADGKVILELTLDLIKEWYRKLKPDYLKISGELGFEEPATTGQALGYLSILMGLTGLNLQIKPNFEKAIMDMSVLLKGKFLLWHFIWPLLKYILKKPIWKLIRKFLFRKGEKV